MRHFALTGLRFASQRGSQSGRLTVARALPVCISQSEQRPFGERSAHKLNPDFSQNLSYQLSALSLLRYLFVITIHHMKEFELEDPDGLPTLDRTRYR